MQQYNTTTQTRWSPWDYRETSWRGTDINGFTVEATDGSIGKIDQATDEVGGSFLIVDTGPWIFGKKVMLPAGVVNRVDHDNHIVFVDRSKEHIKNAPEYDENKLSDTSYRDQLGGYYGEGGGGWIEPGSTY